MNFNFFRTVQYSLLLIIAGSVSSCVATRDPVMKQARLLQRGKITEDTSFVYALPYSKKTDPLIVQGYYGAFSHKKRAALDFKMKQGTPILAAREGVVIRMEKKNTKGGGNKKYREFANYIVIQHNDNTRAGYWHLKKDGALVNVGDTVKQGQLIGLSGKTGYAAIGHLHFLVWQSKGGRWQPLPTRFMTKKGAKYLRPWRSYRGIKEILD